MGCVDERTLEALRDGKLAATQVREAREHLGRCAECRRRALALASEAKRMLDLEPRYPVMARQIERWIVERSGEARQ